MQRITTTICLFTLATLFVCSISLAVELEPFTYTQDFETKELSAWASYPLWQDTAYDPHFHVGTIVPGDPNISVMQKVTPYTNVDNYAGAQKKLDMYMTPGSRISLRFYLKSHLPVDSFKIRIAAGPDGKADYTITNPQTNRWVWANITFSDVITENPRLAGKKHIKVNALAVLAKIPDADPTMPIYLGIDDVTFKGSRAVHFAFAEPDMHKLSEWIPYIPARHYQKGGTFTVSGRWELDADSVNLTVTPFANRSNIVQKAALKKREGEWSTSFKVPFPSGLYHATLRATAGKEPLSETEFSLFVVPGTMSGNHPRLWFDEEKMERIIERLNSERFKSVADGIRNAAKNARENTPVDGIVWEMDQFHTRLHTGNSLPSIYPWFGRINAWRSGVYNSALAYALLGDEEAGDYGKALMVKLASFPYWLHPWFFERGRHIYYPIGELGMEYAIGYDLLYGIMDENERKAVRDAMMKNVILGCHKGYVEDDIVTSNTSNWVAHITGGSLMCQAALYADDPSYNDLEPYLTGALMKDYDLIQKAFGRDGAYGEGYGYYNFSMLSWSKTLPAVENVFSFDMSGKINESYHELIWAGFIKNKESFYFGDSGGNLRPLTNWAWLLPKYHDSLLGWLYNHVKRGESLMDVLYETDDVPRDDPFDENPVKVFRDVGTTVFKSGWEPDDFVFVMRTGAFYNHQHLDQGSFWLSDLGSTFIEERHGSTYYDDPLYQSWYTQPIAHSTILIDGNHQSQRVGDPLEMAEGFHDHAFLHHFLDGKHASFSSGDIGRLYWGNVKDMKRNVLYIKPRTILLVDTVEPASKDVDVTLLFQTSFLDDISADATVSTITMDSIEKMNEDPNKFRGEVTDTSTVPIDEKTLYIRHLFPGEAVVQSVETPHYLNTLKNNRPLKKEGMLTVSARTGGRPLVIANLLTTTNMDENDSGILEGNGFMAGTVKGAEIAFSTRPGSLYEYGDITTDALAITQKQQCILAARCTTIHKGGKLLIDSTEEITVETEGTRVTCYCAKTTEVAIGTGSKPSSIVINGTSVRNFMYDAERKAVIVTLPSGKGIVKYEL